MGLPAWRPERLPVVDIDVSRAKFAREIAEWSSNQSTYKQRGWVLVNHGDLFAEVMLVVRAEGALPLPLVAVAFGLDYTNYDLEPPSLTFLDPFTWEPAAPGVPPQQVADDGQIRSLAPTHPTTRRPFLCLPGNLEYHTHPQHDGDLWLVDHREAGDGRLSTITERLWLASARHLVVGIGLAVQLTRDADAMRADAGVAVRENPTQ